MTRSITNYDRDIGWTGLIAPNTYPHDTTSLTLTANKAYVARFVPSRDMGITLIGFHVVTGTGSGSDPVDVGLYDASLGTRIVSSGATTTFLAASNTSAAVSIAATTLTAGTTYFAAFACSTAPTLLAATWPSSKSTTLFGTIGASGFEAAAELTTSYPLPSSLSSAVDTSGVPILAVRES